MAAQGKRPEVVAIVPARGGSKGIPRKNVRLLAGKPLIAHTIEAARRSRLVDRVVISTDDPEIAEVAKSFGAEAPFLRPAVLSGDRALILDAVTHALTQLYGTPEPGVVTLTLFPTHPFRPAGLIDFLTGKLLDGCHTVATVKRVEVARSTLLQVGPDGAAVPVLHREWGAPAGRQSLYRPYGLFLGAGGNPDGQGYVHVIRDKPGLVDLDTMHDWRLAERILASGLFRFEAA